MRRVLLVGAVGCGKTTLCQCLNGLSREYRKTQTFEVCHKTIDSPGEYLERRVFFPRLVVVAAEVEQVLFVLDATQERFMFSPGMAAAFPVPVAGVISKIDSATAEERRRARVMLELTGATPIL